MIIQYLRRILLSSLLLLLLSILIAPQIQAQSVHRHVLENGLTVITVDRRDTHAAHIKVLVRASSEDEGELLGTGVSRLLQEMIVLGAREDRTDGFRFGDQITRVSSDILVQGVSQLGFSLTTTDTFFVDGLRFLARALIEPPFNQSTLERSKRLLANAEEREVRDISASALRSLMHLVYREIPTRLPARGRRDQRNKLELEEVQGYHSRQYMANRTTVIVVGNIDSNRVLQEVEMAFKEMPVGHWAIQTTVNEPLQFAQRTQRLRGVFEEPYRLYGWRTPNMRFYQDHAGLEVLQYLIQRELEQLLYTEHDGHRIARNVETRFISNPRIPGVFTIAVRPNPLSSMDGWFIIQETLDRFRQVGPSEQELEIAKRYWRRREAERLSTVAGTAKSLSRWEQAIGVPDFSRTYALTVGQLTVDDIRRISAQYLHPKGVNLSQVTISPTVDQQDPPGPGQRSTLSDVAPRIRELPLGARLLHRYMPIGLTHVRITMNAGSSVEPQDMPGITSVLADLLRYGSHNISGSKLDAFLEQYGMELQVQSTDHRLDIHLACFPEDVTKALDFLVDLIKQPALPESVLERIIAQQRSLLTLSAVSWNDRLINAVDRIMLSGHYASRDAIRHREMLDIIDKEAVQSWHEKISVTGNMIFSVYGEYEAQGLEAYLASILEAEPAINAGQSLPMQGGEWGDWDAAAVTTLTVNEDADEAIALTWQAPDFRFSREDMPAMEVLTAILTGNQGRGGRLARALEKVEIDPSTALQVHSRHMGGRGYWSILIRVPPGRLEEVRTLLIDEVATVVRALTSSSAEEQGLLSDRAIAAARFLTVNARILAMEDQNYASLQHAQALLRNIPIEQALAYQQRLSNIDRSDVARVAGQYLQTPPIIIQLARPEVEDAAAEEDTSEEELPSDEEENLREQSSP